MMSPLIVSLGADRFRIERPWGDLPAGLGQVTDVTCDHRGHVFVLFRKDPYVDAAAPGVVELSAEGRQIRCWGEEIADAHCLTAAADGRLLVVDRDAHEVIIFSAEGTRIGALGRRHHPGEPFCHPTDVSVAPSGEIYVSDGYGASRVHRFSPDGLWLSCWGSPGRGDGQFSNPHALWVCADGRIFVVDRENDRVQLFAPDGDFKGSWTDFYRPTAIFGDANDNIFITDAHPRLTRLSGGAATGRCRPVLNGAHGLFGDRTGRLYLAESSPSRLSRLVPITTS